MLQTELFGEVIHSYTRAQAIEDGVLVDVSEVASEAGIRFPVAVTRAVWGQYVEVPPGVECQDEQGRLWDILWMLYCAIRREGGGDRIFFEVTVRNHNGKLTRKDRVKLEAVCGPGDDGEAVITVLLPDED